MNIVFSIGIYMLASSLIMVGYVWFKYVKHTQSDHQEMSETNDYTQEAEPRKEILAA